MRGPGRPSPRAWLSLPRMVGKCLPIVGSVLSSPATGWLWCLLRGRGLAAQTSDSCKRGKPRGGGSVPSPNIQVNSPAKRKHELASANIQYLHTPTPASCPKRLLRTMEAGAKGLLFILMASHFPVAVISFCLPATAAPAHQLHHAASSSSRYSVLGATATADNTPTATPSTENDHGADNRSSSERFDNFAEFLVKTQSDICSQAETSDGKATFCIDRWEREGASKVWLLQSTAGDILATAVKYCAYTCRHSRICTHGAETTYPAGYADGNVLVCVIVAPM